VECLFQSISVRGLKSRVFLVVVPFLAGPPPAQDYELLEENEIFLFLSLLKWLRIPGQMDGLLFSLYGVTLCSAWLSPLPLFFLSCESLFRGRDRASFSLSAAIQRLFYSIEVAPAISLLATHPRPVFSNAPLVLPIFPVDKGTSPPDRSRRHGLRFFFSSRRPRTFMTFFPKISLSRSVYSHTRLFELPSFYPRNQSPPPRNNFASVDPPSDTP